MSKIVDFFSFIFKGIVSALTFAVSAPGLILTSVASLFSSVSSIVSQVSSSTSALSRISVSVNEPLEDVLSSLYSMPPIMQWISYLLSLDVLFEGLYALIGIVVPLVLVFATFLFITLPLFLFHYYMLKFTVWVVTSVFPPQYIPSILYSIGNNSPLSVGASSSVVNDGGFVSTDLNI